MSDIRIRQICLVAHGNQFLETVSPQPGEHDTPGGRYLHRRGGDGGYMVIMQVPRASFASYQERVDRLVSQPGTSESGMGMQLHPKDVPGAIAEIRWNVDEDRDDGEWWPASANWQRTKHTEIVNGIRAAEIQTADDLVTICGMRLRLV